MVGPWQVPVADAAVTNSDYVWHAGEAMAIGERSPIAVVDEAASVRMAVGEAITNLRSAGVASLEDVRICANWMASSGVEGECNSLYNAVRSVALELCLELGISIPVGKDSLSMMTEWTDTEGSNLRVQSPVSLVASAFAPLNDVRSCLTPQLRDDLDSKLLLVDLGDGRNRMGMSVLHQTHKCAGGAVPNIDDASTVSKFFHAIGELIESDLILAYHDRSDGGLFATLCEMSFAGRVGLDITIECRIDPISFFFNEELGAAIQIEDRHVNDVFQVFKRHGIESLVQPIGKITDRNEIKLSVAGQQVYAAPRSELHRIWSELTYRMQSLRGQSAGC